MFFLFNPIISFFVGAQFIVSSIFVPHHSAL